MLPSVGERPGLPGRSGWVPGSRWAAWGRGPRGRSASLAEAGAPTPAPRQAPGGPGSLAPPGGEGPAAAVRLRPDSVPSRVVSEPAGAAAQSGGAGEKRPPLQSRRGASSGAGASTGLSASPGATGGWRARDVSGPACRGRPGPGRSAPWSLSPSRWLGLRRQASGRDPVCPSPHPRQVAAARTRPGTPGARGCEAWVSGAGKQRDTQSLWGGPGPGVRLRSLTGSRVLGLLGASSPGTGRTEASPEEGDRENNGAPTRGAWRGSCRLGRESEMSPHRTTLSGRLAGSQGGSGPFGGRDFPRAGEGQGSRAQPPPAHAGDQGLPPAVLARCR